MSRVRSDFRIPMLGFALFFSLRFVAIVTVLLASGLFPNSAYALTITLAWNPNAEADLDRYRVFSRAEGESYDYENPDWEGTNTTCTLYNLDDNTNYYFVARAVDTAGNVSGNSNQVFYQIPPPLHTLPDGSAYGQIPGGDQTHVQEVNYSFEGTSGDVTIDYEVYDVDLGDEVEILINGEHVGYTAQTSDGNWSGTRSVLLFDEDVFDDQTNLLTFRNTYNPPNDWPWGVREVDLGAPPEPSCLAMCGGEGVGGCWCDFSCEVRGDCCPDYGELCLPQNEAPIADAGPDRTVGEGNLVTLDGSNSSDPDGTIISYEWVQMSGTPVTLSDSTSPTPWLTAPFVAVGGEALTFGLTVTDNDSSSDTDTVIINVSNINRAPIADAGPDQALTEADTITLDGSNSSDPDGVVVSYSWAQTAGPAVALSDSLAAQPTFMALDVGPDGESLTFQLTVRDNGGLQATDICIVNITWVNLPPAANAGADQTVAEGASVVLNGSNSTDPDDSIASYLWTQTTGSPVTLSDPGAVMPSFTTPSLDVGNEALTFRLTVTDSGGLSDTDTVTINVSNLNQAPIADAGADQTRTEAGTVTLDGSNSSDPDGMVVSYSWNQTAGPAVALSDPLAVKPTFIAPDVGPNGESLTFLLTVTDNGGLQATDTCDVNVTWVDDAPPAPPTGLRMEFSIP